MSTCFARVLGRCVASWNVLKREAGSAGVYELLKRWERSPSEIEEKLSREDKVEPYGFQKEVYEKLKRLAETGGLLVVEAPTASGKTEAVAAAFLSQLAEGDWWLAPRLVYTLPTRALTLTSYARLSSYSIGVASMLNLPKPLPTSFEYGSSLGEKHYLYGGPVVAATFDAVAYGYVALRAPGVRAMRNPRLSFPAALLSTSLVVLDEVQLFQDEHYYSPAIIGSILRQLVGAGALVVIMSATLPSTLREELTGGLKYEHVVFSSGNVKRGKVTVDVSGLKKGWKLPGALNEEPVRREIEDALSSGNVLVVTNTVKKAVECYEFLKKHYADKVLLVHGKMTNADREEREEELFRGGRIVVSTQVVEAGFDFEASFAVTELAPLDSLIQRVGRVARREGTHGRALIVGVDNEAPYLCDLVEATRALLEKDPSALEESLYSVNKAESFLNDIYKKELVEKMKREAARTLLEAESFLRSLRLFSFPPEEDFKLREGFYVTAVVPEAFNSLLNQSFDLSKVDKSTFEHLSRLLKGFREISASRNKKWQEVYSESEWNTLSYLLEKSSLTIGWREWEKMRSAKELPDKAAGAGEKRREGGRRTKGAREKLSGILVAELSVRRALTDRGERGYLVELRGGRPVKPFRTYVLKPELYHREKGLVL